ncbi:hypothetical protein MAXJ12_09543 [Mesorhizobium alhagi CCNWXJ12-2]|uniref:Uncharacterized protein n=2 Tax=Allomesorhizobium alhagi TaxID=475067 RepID=H0HP31_9HYPH|nr:hypothetical protein MAXJ12_09543 [Mesorhizobium alhagi CCNWXJ12-2]
MARFRKPHPALRPANFFPAKCRFAAGRFDYRARQENASPGPAPVFADRERRCVMDMSMMMITNHMAAASKRGSAKAFQWTEHGLRDAAARFVAATLVVAIVFAFLEFAGSLQTAEEVAARADVTASTAHHSLR